jgi:hypothetical protein
VKSAKRIGGAIGQLLVQLELDAKRVPEGLRNAPYPPKAPAADFNIKILTDQVKVVGDPLNGNTLAEGIGVGVPGGDPGLLAPFAAQQLHQAAIAALYYRNPHIWTIPAFGGSEGPIHTVLGGILH